ncbi:uncharacterized protein LOC133187935 [Saccostrea echinata]|uniref:uncharacterized protein LOC133187935 n=1 Tax=Saccostrea echinata TaxID=191078 RepID=UPI002A820A24|nr:uncharacterized protein LOC133187935 [Saccostrea echinata]
MAHITQAQKMKLCNHCLDPVYNFCRKCQIGLCKVCTANHFVLKPSEVHDISPYKYRNGSQNFFPQCACQSVEKPTFYCYDCYTSFCIVCEENHRLHISGCISENIHVLVEMIQEQNLELLNNIIPNCQSMIETMKTNISELPGKYNGIRQELETHRKLVHKAIDEKFKREFERLSKMEVNHHTRLLDHLVKYRQKIRLLHKTVKRNNLVVSNAAKLQEANPLKKFTPVPETFPEFVEYKIPSYTVNLADLDKIHETIVGSLQEREIVVSSETLKYQRVFGFKPMKTPEQIQQISLEFFAGDIVCERGGTVWVCGLGSRTIMQYDLLGSPRNTLPVTSQPSFLSLNSSGHLFFTEFRDSSVKSVSHKLAQPFIKTKGWQPRGIQCDENDNVLVSEFSEDLKHSRIAKYDRNGSLVNAIEYDEEKVPIFENILFICQNKNGDIGATEREKATVTIVRKNGRKRFQYSGRIRSSAFTDFGFSGISSDSRCNFVISDPHNYTLHVIDWQGKFLFYVMPGKIIAPMAICVDEEDRVWVSEARGMMKVLTYME